MNLEGIRLNEISQIEEKYCMVSLKCWIFEEKKKVKFIETEKESGYQGLGEGKKEKERLEKMYKLSCKVKKVTIVDNI